MTTSWYAPYTQGEPTPLYQPPTRPVQRYQWGWAPVVMPRWILGKLITEPHQSARGSSPSLAASAGQRREPLLPPKLAVSTCLISGVAGGSQPRSSDKDNEEEEHQQPPDLAWKVRWTANGKTPTTGIRDKTKPSIYTTEAAAHLGRRLRREWPWVGPAIRRLFSGTVAAGEGIRET
jgi:hypothetical protein